MASDLQTATGLGAGQKKGLYKELRQNPYLLGLSAVCCHHTRLFLPSLLKAYSSLRLVASSSVTTKVWYLGF
jgi:hypothetical protein